MTSVTAACGLMVRETTRSTSPLNRPPAGLIPEPLENAVARQHAEPLRDANPPASEPIAGGAQPA